MLAVVEPKVARHACQDDEIGLAQGTLAGVSEQAPVLAAQKTACHAGEVDGDAESRDRIGQGARRFPWVGVQQCLASHQQDRALRPLQSPRVASHQLRGRRRRVGDDRGRERIRLRTPEHPIQVAVQAPPPERGFRAGTVPHPHDRFIVQQIYRALDEDGAGNTLTRDAKCVLELGDEIADPTHRGGPFHMWAREGKLIDVLERAASLEGCRRRTAQEHHR